VRMRHLLIKYLAQWLPRDPPVIYCFLGKRR
jgi:hypothetical protein